MEPAAATGVLLRSDENTDGIDGSSILAPSFSIILPYENGYGTAPSSLQFFLIISDNDIP